CTVDGITAIQMDIKIKGINEEILRKALAQAKKGRLFILDKMLEVLPAPKTSLSKYAPKIVSFSIDPNKIKDVIGSGGKVINKIIDETGVKIDIDDYGNVLVSGIDDAMNVKAKKIIDLIANDPEVGEEFEGTVVRIMSFGAFVEIAP
ncbi:MAG: KH domain-containing protein, partial [Clostridia bacterium]|nr:KH domain-containing protein [Clostridia bacterium]